MALPAGRYGVTKNQLLKIKKLPMNTIKLIEELTEKFDLLGSAAFKNSVSVVTESSDLVESGAVKDIVGWGNKNLLPNNGRRNDGTAIFTYNPDGMVQVTGSTDSSNSQFRMTLPTDLYGNYYFSGCPAGGGDSTYDLYAWDNTTGSRIKKWDGTTNSGSDFGETLQQIKLVAGHDNSIVIRIRPNQSNLNLLFKPMVSKDGGAYEPYHASVLNSLAEKCDNSVIGTVEDGTNPTKAYAVSEHMIRGGKFCTVTVAVTTSSTWTLGSNYVEGTIADNVLKKVTFSGTTNASGNMALISGERKNIISAIMDGGEMIALPYFSQYGNTNIHVVNSSFSVVANTAVSGTYYYI